MNQTEHYLEKLHLEILDIMDEIHKICEENNIKYFMIGGTLLGAIRHGGYIPWDDDLDIAIPREDYERFLIIAPEKLSKSYSLVTFDRDSNYHQPFAKVVKKNTLFKETPTGNMGIFVDVFPYDYTKGVSKKLIFKKNLYRVFCDVPNKFGELPFRFKYLPSIFLRLFLGRKKALRFADSIAQSIKRKGSTHYSNFASGYKIIRETYPIEWFDNCTLSKFEDRLYYIPENSEGVLSTVFGTNYMQLPPENLRKTHCPLEVIFTDGEKMVFEHQGQIVQHKDVESFGKYQ